MAHTDCTLSSLKSSWPRLYPCCTDFLYKLYVRPGQEKGPELGVSHLGRALTRRVALEKAFSSMTNGNNTIYGAPAMPGGWQGEVWQVRHRHQKGGG